MFTKYNQAVSDIQGKFEGGVSFDIDWGNLFEEGAREARKFVSPATIKRKVAIYGGLAIDLPVYTAPTDVHTPAALYPNEQQFNGRNYKYQAAQAFFQEQEQDAYTIDFINGIPFIYANVGVGNVLNLMNAVDPDDLTGSVTMAKTLRSFLSGSSAIVGTFTDTTYDFIHALGETLDLSDYQRGVILVPFETADPTQIEAIAVHLRTADTDYFTVTTAADVLGNQFTTGWNMARLDLSVRTSTGSPLISSIVDMKVDVQMKTGQSQEVNIGDISLHQTNDAMFEYYSNKNFRDTDGVWISKPEDDDDEVLFVDEAYDVWQYCVCELVVQNASYDAVDSKESTRITKKKEQSVLEYRRKFPSMQKPQSYNISSDVSL